MAESMEVVQENPLDMFDVLCDHKFADKRLNKMYEFLYDLLKKDPNCNLKDEYKDLVFKITEQRFECYIITRERERVAKDKEIAIALAGLLCKRHSFQKAIAEKRSQYNAVYETQVTNITSFMTENQLNCTIPAANLFSKYFQPNNRSIGPGAAVDKTIGLVSQLSSVSLSDYPVTSLPDVKFKLTEANKRYVELSVELRILDLVEDMNEKLDGEMFKLELKISNCNKKKRYLIGAIQTNHAASTRRLESKRLAVKKLRNDNRRAILQKFYDMSPKDVVNELGVCETIASCFHETFRDLSPDSFSPSTEDVTNLKAKLKATLRAAVDAKYRSKPPEMVHESDVNYDLNITVPSPSVDSTCSTVKMVHSPNSSDPLTAVSEVSDATTTDMDFGKKKVSHSKTVLDTDEPVASTSGLQTQDKVGNIKLEKLLDRRPPTIESHRMRNKKTGLTEVIILPKTSEKVIEFVDLEDTQKRANEGTKEDLITISSSDEIEILEQTESQRKRRPGLRPQRERRTNRAKFDDDWNPEESKKKLRTPRRKKSFKEKKKYSYSSTDDSD